ncbi:SDR family NAD(P)-dependent oxidoreductase [Streptomyces sp. NPDC020801]|uniref:SDR family NAD(P)-dependent oxidoreductase n=1 Tax=unclassified Streptomyces TaxID=2593676 RepID=UPI0037A2280E
MARGHDGKVAVITGAAAGIGQAYARRLAEDGVDVVVADVSDAEETVELVRATGRRVLAVRCDVSQESDVASLRDRVVDSFGHCDILVNNAGVMPIVPFADLDLAEWQRTQSINLNGMFLTCKAFVPAMAERGWGRVVNQTSNTVGIVVRSFSSYVASKGGIIGLTRSLASEFGAQGVTVNAIAPGLTATKTVLSRSIGASGQSLQEEFDEFIAAQSIKRIGTPDDLAGAVSFLTSDDASFMTGQTLVIDGGLWRI